MITLSWHHDNIISYFFPAKLLTHWSFHRWNRFSGVIDPAEIVSAVSVTPWTAFQRCKWHRWNSNIINFLGEYEAICKTALGRESGPQVGLIDEKNRGSKISCNCSFKRFNPSHVLQHKNIFWNDTYIVQTINHFSRSFFQQILIIKNPFPT
jgi:hypothetical protein